MLEQTPIKWVGGLIDGGGGMPSPKLFSPFGGTGWGRETGVYGGLFTHCRAQPAPQSA